MHHSFFCSNKCLSFSGSLSRWISLFLPHPSMVVVVGGCESGGQLGPVVSCGVDLLIAWFWSQWVLVFWIWDVLVFAGFWCLVAKKMQRKETKNWLIQFYIYGNEDACWWGCMVVVVVVVVVFGSNETFWNFMCIFVILIVLLIFQPFWTFQCILHVLRSILENFEILRIFWSY